MEHDEKELVHQVVRAHLERNAPDQLPEFDVAFDAVYRSVLSQLATSARPEIESGEQRLPFGPEIIATSLIFFATSVAVLYVREVRVRVGAEEQIRCLEQLSSQLRSELNARQDQLESLQDILREVIARLPIEPQGRSHKPEKATRLSGDVPRLSTPTEPVDLVLRVRTRPVRDGLVLAYEVASPSGTLDLLYLEAESKPLNVGDLKREHMRLFTGLERLLRRLDDDGEQLLGEEIGDELLARGQDLYLRLFPDRLKDFYRRHRDRIRSLLVVSDKPWIPWELIRPDEFDDDDFLCMRFPMGRWFAGPHGPAPAIRVERLLCAEAAEVQDYPVLSFARAERERLVALAADVSGLVGEVLEDVRFAELTDRLKRGGFDLIHFAGHADHDAEDPDRSKLLLTDRPFPALWLTGKIQRRIAKDRPLVFLNACRVARLGLALTGVGDWPDRWVRLGKCGALLCPQWAVRDSSAGTFSKTFYRRLREGATLGEAVLEARRQLRATDPTDPTYLAYSLYGHPNAAVGFGIEAMTLPRRREVNAPNLGMLRRTGGVPPGPPVFIPTVAPEMVRTGTKRGPSTGKTGLLKTLWDRAKSVLTSAWISMLAMIVILAVAATLFLWDKHSEQREKAAVSLGVAFGLVGQSAEGVGQPVFELSLQRLGFPPHQIQELSTEFSEVDETIHSTQLKDDRLQKLKDGLVDKVKTQLYVLEGIENQALIDFGHDLTLLLHCLRSWDQLQSDPGALVVAHNYQNSLRESSDKVRLPSNLVHVVEVVKTANLELPTSRQRTIEALTSIVRNYGQE